jgi:hypothetical protein
MNAVPVPNNSRKLPPELPPEVKPSVVRSNEYVTTPTVNVHKGITGVLPFVGFQMNGFQVTIGAKIPVGTLA